ncbi:glucose 1-dehydrogenase/3-oxoacyl-[acyl-carrier protein] reductase [Streptosporangium subroseum]|uniref:Glucose 1-dehydrogenase/3-oxoacyl-[acyl-carrier protein] reductase n=1 Tax=Streptosporangium subroseum TaxID=106412 RepID=A0A239J433_9ACTN|nr:SDR family oxidoreductase [Streptosporangium subroseum]SNT00607.1 glucose 1-dehydrogenase/3-oxoacyl-[acyl-carrier protein] reductase [Streptosporangium subroseum]
MRFSDKVAVVTGADSGIGRATAVRLLSEGATVVAADVNHTRPWAEAGDKRLHRLTLDVSEPDAAERLEEYLRGEFERIDVLANVAGILHIAPFLQVTRADWDRVLAVNLTGVFFLSQAVARIMVDHATPGRIVNVSSVHAVVSEPNAAPYTATKGGLEAMTRTMASELAPHGITVNCVRPGATRTAMSEPIYTPEILGSLKAKIPLGKIAPPEWVASAIAYLASEEACYTTGACLDVDGGYAMDGSLPGTAYS